MDKQVQVLHGQHVELRDIQPKPIKKVYAQDEEDSYNDRKYSRHKSNHRSKGRMQHKNARQQDRREEK